MEYGEAYIDAITAGERHRHVDDARVDALAESMREIGLLQPVTIWSPDENTCVVVTGLHRVRAAEKLGWNKIACFFTESGEIDRELMEIDENLIRSELTPSEEAAHMARRKELFEARKEAERNSGTNCSETPKPGRPEGFAADTAKKTGQTKQSVNRAVARGQLGPEILDRVNGTDMDKAVELDALKRLKPEDRMQAIERVESGASDNLRAAVSFILGEGYDTPVKQPSAPRRDDEVVTAQVAALMALWNRTSPEAREAFLERIDTPVFDKTECAA